jgi:catechol 2,3-dioxygenase-like lactoylglutathione lyase family enzyme
MKAQHINPILNVSDIRQSFAWFEQWGWKKLWDWGTPPTFGAVGSGGCEIFLCQGGQGGRGRGANEYTFGPNGDQIADKGVWMAVFVDGVDEVHKQCLAAGLEITFPPTNMPWGVREMHLRHPDGHVFRVGTGTEEER